MTELVLFNEGLNSATTFVFKQHLCRSVNSAITHKAPMRNQSLIDDAERNDCLNLNQPST